MTNDAKLRSRPLPFRAAAPEGSADLDDRMRPLTPAEKECKDLVYQRLLKVMDLSLISSLPEREARNQIRDICERLISDEQAPLGLASRQCVVRRVEDEVLGLG